MLTILIPPPNNSTNTTQKSIVVLLLLVALSTFLISIYLYELWLMLLPIVFVAVFYFMVYPQNLYYLLLIVIPISIEYDVANSVIDLPSEPILIFLSGIVGVYLLLYHKKINIIFNKNYIVLFIMLHLFWALASLPFSTNLLVSFKTVSVKIIYIVGFYLATLVMLQNLQQLKKILLLLIGGTLLTLLIILIRHALLGFTFDNIHKAVEPIYRNHVNYGVFMSMLLPYLFYLRHFHTRYTLKRLLYNIAILLWLIAIYFTYTRGAWLAIMVMPLYYLVIRYKLSKSIIGILIIILVLFTTVMLNKNKYLNYAPNYNNTIYHEKLSEHLNSTFAMEDMSTVERFHRWLAAVKMSKHHLFFGVGAGNFVSNYQPYTVTAYRTYISDNKEKSSVHNYILLLLAEQGLPAVLIFLGLMIVILLTIENQYHHNSSYSSLYLAIGCSLIAFLLNNLLSDLVEANKVGSLFWINIALLSVFNKNTPNKD